MAFVACYDMLMVFTERMAGSTTFRCRGFPSTNQSVPHEHLFRVPGRYRMNARDDNAGL